MILFDIRRMLWRVALDVNPTTVRSWLALGSFFWAIALLLGPQTFQRQGYSVLAAVSTEQWWALVFMIHALGTLWRFCELKSRKYMAVVIDCYGLFIWFFTTAAANIAIGAFSPTSSLEWVAILFQGWIIVQPRFKRGVVTL